MVVQNCKGLWQEVCDNPVGTLSVRDNASPPPLSVYPPTSILSPGWARRIPTTLASFSRARSLMSFSALEQHFGHADNEPGCLARSKNRIQLLGQFRAHRGFVSLGFFF